MSYQYTPYIWPLLISGGITLALGIYSMSRCKGSKGALSYSISMFIVTLWSIPNALEMSGTTLEVKLFWANIQYIAYGYSPVVLLVLCLQFTAKKYSKLSKKVVLLFIVPTLVQFFVWTDKFHGLVRYNIHLEQANTFLVISKQYGFVFFIHALYSHIINFITLYLLIKSASSRKTIYRKQVIALLIGVCMIVFPNVLYVLKLSPIKQFDITPVFFGPAGIIMAWNLLRYRMFDLVPLAWSNIIETMNAGVIVMNSGDKVLDVNSAFSDMIRGSVTQLISQKAEVVCKEIPEFYADFKNRSKTRTEFTYLSKIYEVHLSTLIDKGQELGRLAVIFDITQKRQVEEEYLKQQQKNAVINERESLARDLHDNLGQVLGFIGIQAQAIRKELSDLGNKQLTSKMDQLIRVTRTAHYDLRNYIRVMKYSEDTEFNFLTSLENEIESFEDHTGIKVNLEIIDEFSDLSLSVYEKINILNIIKEALNNVRKHAEAKQIRITFENKSSYLCITVKDDGKGFLLLQNHEDTKPGLGLDIMRERADSINGKLDIVSNIGEGSSIILYVPLKEGNPSEVKGIVG